MGVQFNQAGGKKINAATGAAGSSSGPVSNKVRQVGITQKVMTDADVENWVHEMMKKLEPQMPVIEKDFVQRAIDKSGGNSVALSNMAVAAFIFLPPA